MYDELVKRLRDEAETERYLLPHSDNGTAALLEEAADAIEELSKDLEREKDYTAFWEKTAEEARATAQKWALALAKQPRWIPVTERLPEDLTFVLVVEDGTVFIAHCEHYYGEEEVFVEWHDTMYYPVSPTHWMPLPEPPKEG